MRTEDAVGQMLCHDITRIIRGVSKGPVFKKGHIITEEDIPVLLSVGKDTIYIWEVNENMMHENDAARVLCELSINEHMHASDISEGKIELIADCPGLLKVDKKRLNAINSLGEMMIFCNSSLENCVNKAPLVLFSVILKSTTIRQEISNLSQMALIPKHAPKASISMSL